MAPLDLLTPISQGELAPGFMPPIPGVPASAATVLAGIESNLWHPPEIAHDEDDEFEGALSADWQLYTDGGVADDWSASDVAVYTDFTSGDPRKNVNDIRKSWALFQPPRDGSSIWTLTKEVAIPTNFLIWARIRRAPNLTTTSGEGNGNWIGLIFAGDDGGDFDDQNWIGLIQKNIDANGAISGSRIDYVARTAGSTVIRKSTSTNIGTESWAYVAIHKVGTNYHPWAGSAEGHWWRMEDTTLSYTPTMSRIGFLFGNNQTANPGSPVVGADFVRCVETASFPL